MLLLFAGTASLPNANHHVRAKQLQPNPAVSSASSSSTSAEASPSSSSSATVTIVNESMISLLLRLHSKYSGRYDSYVPIDERSSESVTKEYRESRIGDACFFVEKVLDRVCEMDESCRQSVDTWRKQLWPHYHAQEARRDEEMEKREAEEKKRRAKERQRKMMEQLAAQRRRFMESNAMGASSSSSASAPTTEAAETAKEGTAENSGGDSAEAAASGRRGSKAGRAGSATGAAAAAVEEYTCCHCLSSAPASEDRPIGLVALIQSTSVLAHRHHKTGHLALPTSEEEEERLRQAFEGSLGTELTDRFNEMSYLFGLKSTLLSLNNSWRGGIHIQSCGHHMHYDCRQSYCETLKQQVRVARDQALDTDHGEFICPMCRQMANALLPVPPEPPNLPAAVFPK